MEREFAAGDRVQFTAPNRVLGIANRDLGTVASLEGGKMTLRMDGKSARMVTLDTAEFRQFDHGYAVTSHSSQGLTAGRVLAHIDTESSRSLINNRLAYVAISRASDDVRIYTNDAQNLGTRLSHEVSKTAALNEIDTLLQSKQDVSMAKSFESGLQPVAGKNLEVGITNPNRAVEFDGMELGR